MQRRAFVRGIAAALPLAVVWAGGAMAAEI